MEDKKIIIITGASSGIGFETAKFLGQSGYKVYGFSRRLEKMMPLKKFGVIPIKIDLLDQEKLTTEVKKIIEKEKRIDVIINNAGYTEQGAIIDVKKEDAQRQININVVAPIELFKLVFPTMRKQEKGLIINISSMGGRITFPLMGWYHASKYSLEALSNAMRMEYKKYGIDTVLVEPGAIKTEFYDVVEDKTKKLIDKSIFREQYKASLETTKDSLEKYTDPIVIAKLIDKIINSKKPKARYVSGYLARPLLFVGKYFPNTFDKIIKKIYKLN